MSCGVGCRCGLDAALLWLWRRLAAVARIGPLAWELPYATGAAPKRQKKKKKKKKENGKMECKINAFPQRGREKSQWKKMPKGQSFSYFLYSRGRPAWHIPNQNKSTIN